MSDFTWTETPNDPSQPLAMGPFTPLHFTSAKVIEHIIVDVGLGGEEVAYRDGAFRGAYAASSTIDGTKKIVAIYRTGGWPSPPKVYPKTETPPPQGGQAFKSLYEVDLTSQPSQGMSAAGAYTIDGYVWWAKGAISAGGGTCDLVNGSGMRMHKSIVQYNLGWRSQASAFADRCMAFDPTQLANFNPAAPLAFLARFTSPGALTGSNDRGVVIGMGDFVKSSASLTAADKAKTVCLNVFGTGSAYWDPNPTINVPVNILPTSVGTVYGNIVTGIYRFSRVRYYPMVGAWAGGFTTPDDYVSFNPTVTPAFTGNGMSTSPGFYWVLEKGSGGEDLDIYLTHLRIMQPKSA